MARTVPIIPKAGPMDEIRVMRLMWKHSFVGPAGNLGAAALEQAGPLGESVRSLHNSYHARSAWP